MSMRWHNQQHEDHVEPDEDTHIWEKEIDNKAHKNAKRQMIKRKLEEKIEIRRIRSEISDYEQELDEDFDWNDYDKK